MCWSYVHLIFKGPCNKWKPQKRAGFSENLIQEQETNSVLILQNWKVLSYISKCFAYKYVDVSHVWLVPKEALEESAGSPWIRVTAICKPHGSAWSQVLCRSSQCSPNEPYLQPRFLINFNTLRSTFYPCNLNRCVLCLSKSKNTYFSCRRHCEEKKPKQLLVCCAVLSQGRK